MTFRVIALFTMAVSTTALGQEVDRDTSAGRRAGILAVFYDDTNLVHPSWSSFQMTKNLVAITFRVEASRGQRMEAVALVRGVLIDTTPPFWIVRVSSHPDACGVLRATERLQRLAWVRGAMPDFFIPFDDGISRNEAPRISVPEAPARSVQPCPVADSVLR